MNEYIDNKCGYSLAEIKYLYEVKERLQGIYDVVMKDNNVKVVWNRKNE